MFEIIETGIENLLIIRPKKFIDHRGVLVKTFEKNIFLAKGINLIPTEEIETKSTKNVFRGLHYQFKNPQAKLVRVAKGEIIDIVVDLRKNSKTFKEVLSVRLNDVDKEMLYIPKGFAHGYLTVSQESVVYYLADNKYEPEFEFGIKINKEMLKNYNIDFKNLKLSNKDEELSELNQITTFFDGELK